MKILSRGPMIGGAVLALLAGLLAVRYFLPPAVEVISVQTGVVREEIRGPGTVQSQTKVNVSSRIQAIVERVLVDQGDSVRRGRLLIQLESRDLSAKAAAATAGHRASAQQAASAEAALGKAQSDLDLARTSHRRDEELFGRGLISKASLDASTAALRAAESAEKSAHALLTARHEEVNAAQRELEYVNALLSYARITAPMDGLVVGRSVEPGSLASPGQTLLQIANPAALWVAAQIDETLVGRVRAGQPARIRLRSGAEVAGEVARIARQSDPVTREVEVDVKFVSASVRFTLNEEAEVAIQGDEVRGITLPLSSLLQRAGVDGVWVVKDGRAAFRPVRLGIIGTAAVQILDGVQAGEAVVRSSESLREGRRVRPVSEGGR